MKLPPMSRRYELDLCRITACIMVIIIHTGSAYILNRFTLNFGFDYLPYLLYII